MRATLRWKVSMLMVVAGLSAATLAACSHQTGQPVALIVLPGAKDVHYGSLAGTKQVRYQLNVEYPAKATLTELSKRLAKQGWEPLKNDFLSPSQPSSHVKGWWYFIDATHKPNEDVQRWLAEWKNADGDVVTYNLEYRWPVGSTPDFDKLQVYGIYISKDLAKKWTKGRWQGQATQQSPK
jgi:hypothetical protein